MPATLKDMAKMLGISPATVSLALRDNPVIAEATRVKVRKLAEELDYIQSNFGRALQSRRSRLIGCVIHGLTESFYNEILQGAAEEAERNDYALIVSWVNSGAGRLDRQLQLLLEKGIDALLVAEHRQVVEPYLAKFKRRKLPVYFCSNRAPEGYCEVITDNIRGGFLAMEYLAQHGHRHVACSSEMVDRLTGNQLAAQRYQLRTSVYCNESEALELLHHDHSIDAVIAYSDLSALSLMHALRTAGRRIPEELSVIGFDGLSIGARPEFSLTTVAQQRSELGRLAVRSLIEHLDDPAKKLASLSLPPELVIRKTVIDRKSK